VKQKAASKQGNTIEEKYDVCKKNDIIGQKHKNSCLNPAAHVVGNSSAVDSVILIFAACIYHLLPLEPAPSLK
jgi:hypothetical protein